MLPTFVIFFREMLEISVILGIIAAATRGVPSRGRWVMAGVGGGVLGAAAVAYFAEHIAGWMEGMGQEMFNATVLLLAAGMIGWTVVWMQRHVRHVVTKIKQVSAAVQGGEQSLVALAMVVSVCMWREGSEIVLFMYGVLTASATSTAAVVLGGAGGTLVAGALGYGLYIGLVTIPTRHFFKVTEWLLILLAAGLVLQATGYLVAADMLSPLAADVWDTSGLVSDGSLPGQMLHAMVGYTARPSLVQLLAYGATVVVILGCLRLQNRPRVAV